MKSLRTEFSSYRTLLCLNLVDLTDFTDRIDFYSFDDYFF